MADRTEELIRHLQAADGSPLAGRMVLHSRDAQGRLVLIDADDPDAEPITIDEAFLERLRRAGTNGEAWQLVSEQLAKMIDEIRAKWTRVLRGLRPE